MAPDQCPKDAVPSVGHDTTILWMCIIFGPRIMRISDEDVVIDIIVGSHKLVHGPVVEIGNTIFLPFTLHVIKFGTGTHLTQIPKPERLIFTVGNNVTAIPLRRNVGDSFCVADQHARRFAGGTQRPTVPNSFSCDARSLVLTALTKLLGKCHRTRLRGHFRS